MIFSEKVIVKTFLSLSNDGTVLASNVGAVLS